MSLREFLLVFDLDRQELVGGICEFENPTAAAQAYAALEGEHRGDRNLEIVLIGADSLETVRHTHPNYFGVLSESPYLTGIR